MNSDPPHKPVPTGQAGVYAVEGEKEKSGLFCWRDKDRPCTAECMAFTPPPQAKDYKDQQWASCSLLVNGHRTGKHLVILSEVVSKLYETLRGTVNKLPDPPIPR